MKIIIVEDEPLIAARLERICKQHYASRLQWLKCFSNRDLAIDFIDSHPFDLLLLDLNLKGQDGFELLKSALAQAFQTIIVSAYAEKAITAFEFGVLDFVCKPFSEDRLIEAFRRFDGADKFKKGHCKYLSFKTGDNVQLVALSEVVYLQADNVYSQVFCLSGDVKLHNKGLSKLETLLPSRFIRVHKSFVVNMDFVKSIKVHKGSKYEVLLRDDLCVPLGRTYYEKVSQLFV